MFIEIIYFVIITLRIVYSTIAGLTYMDSLDFKPKKTQSKYEDPCKSLYWYPKPIPDYCFQYILQPNVSPSDVPKPKIPDAPSPSLVPALPSPETQFVFPSIPIPLPLPLPLPIPVPQPPIMIQPVQVFNNAFVPPIPGLVSQDGGINILPFSDVYEDLYKGKDKEKSIYKQFGYYFAS